MKKTIAWILATFMIASFASCGNTPPSETTAATTPAETLAPEGTTTEATTPAETTTPEETTAETTTEETTLDETTEETTTTTGTEEPDPIALPEAYADFDFSGSTIKDLKGKVTVQNMGAQAMKADVTAGGKSAKVDALCIRSSGEYVLCTFSEISGPAAMKDFAQAGFTVEAFYVMGKKGAAQGVVCGTELKGGWGLAESKDGKPYFITGNGSAYNEGAYAFSASSTTDLVHVVAVYDYENREQRIYVNGSLNSTTPISGEYFYGDFGCYNKFCLGGDIKATGQGGDFKCSNMTMVDAKIYATTFVGEQASVAYQNALALLQ